MIIQPQKKSPSASETEEGLMSAADKKKLNGITDSADSVEFSQALTSGTIVGYITINGNKYTLYAPTNTDTKYSVMGGATSSAAGAAGLVPAPAAGKQASFLRGDGTWVVPTNTTYSAATTSANGLMSAADKAKSDNTNIAYGTCSTAAATAAKVVSISGNTKWALTAGSIIAVKFTNTNTASNPTLNVNGTGAKSIVYDSTAIASSNLSFAGYANRCILYLYDGTNYVFIGWSVDTDTNTWRSIQDNLTSTSTSASLSANQGRILKGYIDEINAQLDGVETLLSEI